MDSQDNVADERREEALKEYTCIKKRWLAEKDALHNREKNNRGGVIRQKRKRRERKGDCRSSYE